MANLGDLYFNILLKDETAAQKNHIKQQLLRDLNAEIAVKLKDPQSLIRDIQALLKANTFIASIGTQLNTQQLQTAINNTQYTAHITVIATELAESITKAIGTKKYPISTAIDATVLGQQLTNILTTKGYKVNATANVAELSNSIKMAIDGVKHTLKLTVDVPTLSQQLQQILQTNSKLKVTFDKSNIRNDIQTTLGQNPFKINIVVDKASATQAVQMALQQAVSWNGKYTKSDLLAEKAKTEQAMQRYRDAQAALQKVRAAHVQARDAANEHTGASIRLHSALGSNISVAGQLKDQFLSLYSVYAAEQFLSKVVDIGGELEHQRLALDAILKDKGKTQDLFSEIRSLALKSPFGVMNLNQYAKQLSAFTVPYNELYDTMKRLADISAGTGVDMQRLILAYGKTKNRTFLDGLEAKQFAYANIPIYDKLSKKLTELEGKFVSVAEVMKRISKKQISFDMVKDVLWDLTDEGGMFNNMQEVLSGSVKTRWKLVKDALDLMYGDLAESLSTPLKGVADILISLTKNWGKVAAAMVVAAGTYGVVKAANYLLTKGLMAEATATGTEIAATKRSEAAKIRLAATYRQLTAVERYQLTNSKKQIVYDIQAAITSGALTKEKALQLIAMRKLSTEQAKYLVDIKMITEAERLQAASANRWRIAWVQFSNAMRDARASVAKALPSLAWFAGITLAVEAFMKYKEKVKEAKEETENLRQKANETFKNLGESLTTNSLENLPSMTREQIRAAIDEMVQTIKDYHPAAGNVLESIFGDTSGTKDLITQFKELHQAILDLYEAQRIVAQNAELPMNANDKTDGWFDDSLVENINDYSAAMAEMKKAEEDAVSEGISLQDLLQKIADKYPEFKEKAQGKSLSEQLNILRQFYRTLSASSDKVFSPLYKMVAESKVLFDYIDKSKNAFEDFDKLAPDITTWVNYVKSTLSQQGFDFVKGLTGAQEQAVRTLVKTLVDSAKEASPEIRAEIEKQLLEKFNISVSVDFEGSEKAIEQWKERLKQSLQGKYDTVVNAAADYASVIDSVRKAHKEAKEEAEKLKPVLIKAGISFTPGKKITGLSVMTPRNQEIAEQYNEYIDKIDAAVAGANTEGFSLETEKQQRAAAKQAESALTKRLKERLSLLKSAYSEYQRWTELVGKDAALQKLKESNVYSALFSDKNFNIEELRTNIVSIVKQAKAALKDTSAQSFARQGEEELLKFDYDETKKQLDETKQAIEKFVSDTTDQWGLYYDILNKTGNKSYAKLAFSKTGIWDEAAKTMRDKLEQEMSKLNIGDKIINWDMDSAEAKAFFNNNEALLKLYQETQKRIRANARTMLTEGATAIASQYDKEEQIKVLEQQIQTIRDQYKDESMLPEGEEARIQQIQSQIDELKSDLFSLSPLYQQIFGSMKYQDWGAVNKSANRAKELVKNAVGKNFKNGKPSIYKSFYMDGNEKKEVTLTESLLKKLRDSLDGFFDTKVEKNPFSTLFSSIDNLKKLYKSTEKDVDKGKAWREVGASFAACAEQIAQISNSFQEMFEVLGDESAAKAMETVSFVAEGAAAIVQGFASGGVYGGIVAAVTVAVNGLTKIFSAHQAALEKLIKQSEQRVAQIEMISDAIDRLLERSLANYTTIRPASLDDDIAKLAEYTDRLKELDDAIAKGYHPSVGDTERSDIEANIARYTERIKAYQSGGIYAYQRQLLQDELDEKKAQLAALEKEKGDKTDEINEVTADIEELEDQIIDYAEETADSLYSINLKDWASQIGDALLDAWQKGEDGARAFNATVADIMSDVVSNVLKLGVIQPALEKLQTMLFGEDGMSGMFGKDFALDEMEIKTIADYLIGIRDKTDAYYEYLDQIEDYMKKNYGISLKDDDSSGMTKSIQGVTEETADLLASYINAIRADVSVKREYIRQIVEDYMPRFSVIVEAQLRQLEAIAINTENNAKAAEEIKDLLSSNITTGKGFKIA
jgi:hypothetical protein